MATYSDTLEGVAGDLDGGYGAFVGAHADAVYNAALRLSGSHAEADDIAQETFVRAYRALRRYDTERVRALEPRPWLLTITLNLWRNRLRTAARRPRTTTAGPPDSDKAADPRPGPEEAAAATETSRALVRLLGRLPERHRVPVVLRYVVGLSYAEVASVLECPVGTAKANVARGLDRLRVLAETTHGLPAPPRAAGGGPRSRSPQPTPRSTRKPTPTRAPEVVVGGKETS